MKRKKQLLSKISALHLVKLVGRSLLLVAALVIYIYNHVTGSDIELLTGYEGFKWFLAALWCIYVVEMALRFFPSRIESPGCQKQFERNFIPTDKTEPIVQSWRRTLSVLLAWVALNGVIGALYYTHVIDRGILLLVCLAYSVCDMICILFFCPFQAWFMRNRCCTDCRIYNWDFAMMFTPFVFIPSLYTWSLLGLSLLLVLYWEISLRLHPERFSETTNAGVSCQHCTEKLCKHKRHLKSFIKNKKFIKR